MNCYWYLFFILFLLYTLNYIYTEWERLKEIFVYNTSSFPPKYLSREVIFTDPSIRISCHLSAKALFLILTGYDIDIIDQLHNEIDNGNLETEIDSDDQIHYLVYLWEDDKEYTTTQSVHHLLYYKGTIFQSYLTPHLKWTNFFMDGYPLIRFRLTDQEITTIFSSNPSLLNTKQFNEWCAPKCHPIPSNASLRLVKHLSASLNPIRSSLHFEFNNFAHYSRNDK